MLLGKAVDYKDSYDPTLLFPIKREQTVIFGADLWTGYELSWLEPHGKPCVAIFHLQVPADSPFLIESKSLKLYLNTLNQTRFASVDILKETLEQDISRSCGKKVKIWIVLPKDFQKLGMAPLKGICIDSQDISCGDYTCSPKFLKTGQEIVDETLTSDLLRSNCPVTGQPDWASVQISYRGKKICREGLLRYLVSFRKENEFHEMCVEKIFSDLTKYCMPQRLYVFARFTRRGGLEINPYRASHPSDLPDRLIRDIRQ